MLSNGKQVGFGKTVSQNRVGWRGMKGMTERRSERKCVTLTYYQLLCTLVELIGLLTINYDIGGNMDF
jgi:hypothetical protein